MVKQPQALPLRLSRSFWASITKSEPHRMKHSIGPPDLAIDPHNSQIKVKGMGVFTFVSTGPHRSRARVCRGISVVPSYTPLHAFFRPSRSHHPHILPLGSMLSQKRSTTTKHLYT